MPREIPTAPLTGQAPRLAVLDNKRACGVFAPGYKSHTYDWRCRPGSPENTKRIENTVTTWLAEEALTRRFDCEAYIVPYVVYRDGVPLEAHPRMNIPGLPWMRAQSYELLFHGLFVDMDFKDNGGTKLTTWTPEVEAEWADKMSRSKRSLASAGYFRSTHGLKIFLILSRGITAEEYLILILAFHYFLAQDGIVADKICKDWPRLFRNNKVLRDGKPYDGLLVMPPARDDAPGYVTVDPDAMLALYKEECPDWAGAQLDLPKNKKSPKSKAKTDGAEAETSGVVWSDVEDADGSVTEVTDAVAKTPRKSTRTLKVKIPEVFEDTLPDTWKARCEELGRAIVSEGPGEYHSKSLGLAGALMHSRVEERLIPAIVRASLVAGGCKDPYHHATNARDTLTRAANNIGVTGMTRLRREYPIIAHVLHRALATGRDAEFYEETSSVPDSEVHSVEKCAQMICDALKNHSRGVIAIAPDPGSGKTAIMLEHVAGHQMRLRTFLSDLKNAAILRGDEESKPRAPPGSNVCIATDTTALAKQQQKDLLKLGISSKRLASPTAFKHDDGSHVCYYPTVAAALQSCGIPVQMMLCDGHKKKPCAYREDCAARHGFSGDEDANVWFGTHSSMAKLLKHLGEADLLVIDEASAILQSGKLTREMIRKAYDFVGISHRYRAAMRPLLIAMYAFLISKKRRARGYTILDILNFGAEHMSPNSIEDAVRMTGIEDSDDWADVARRAACEAFSPEAERESVPFTSDVVQQMKLSEQYTKYVGDVGIVYNVLYEAIKETKSTAEIPARFWIEQRHDKPNAEPFIVFMRLNAPLVEALRREGPVVLLDAGAHLYIKIYEKIVGYPIPLYQFNVRDGAQITRVQMITRTANKKGWFDGESFPQNWDGKFARALRKVMAWVLEDPECKKIGFVSFGVLERAVFLVGGGIDADARAKWAEWEYPPAELDKAKIALEPILSMWKGEWVFGHYGAMRGVNTYQEADLDAFITMGDPWRNPRDIQREHEMLGFGHMQGDASEEDPEVWMATQGFPHSEAHAKEMLRQAHGRMRECRRVRPMRALHYGSVTPGGYGWRNSNVQLRVDEGGSTQNEPTVETAEFKRAFDDAGMTQGDVAKALGLSQMAISRYLSGERMAPVSVVTRLRAMAPTKPPTETP